MAPEQYRRDPASVGLLGRLHELDGLDPAADHDHEPVRPAVDPQGLRPR